MLRNVLEPWHLLIVVIVVMVMFGSKKLPDTARALGKSMRILKSEAKAMKDDGAVPPASSASPAPSASSASTASPVSPGVPAPQAPRAGQS
ncbi:twin-arginine translocase TatA/TatE family subunit [Streptomyces sp. SID10853]|uniref:Sec-independent protein translocase subunit TatA n=1 Tax=Streptomyces sp. SID10853 TaxID=2706028 RepID=UPI0013C269FA|nr:Sec-independent protein translocase subunit TatA [Streptomyces sp. SID10853]NDZ81255.1 twin-arginine translocase TatA/TatE family subunit [Streptomyces sp. SID10853]